MAFRIHPVLLQRRLLLYDRRFKGYIRIRMRSIDMFVKPIGFMIVTLGLLEKISFLSEELLKSVLKYGFQTSMLQFKLIFHFNDMYNLSKLFCNTFKTWSTKEIFKMNKLISSKNSFEVHIFVFYKSLKTYRQLL